MPATNPRTELDDSASTWSIGNTLVTCRVRIAEMQDQLTWTVTDNTANHVAMGPSMFPQASLDGQLLVRSGPARGDVAPQEDGSTALRITFEANGGAARVSRYFQVWSEQPFVRTWATIRNGDHTAHHVTHAEILRAELLTVEPLTLFHVDQFSWVYRRDFFSQHQFRLVQGRAPLEVRMGAFPSHFGAATGCAWFAARDGEPDRPDVPPNAGSGFVVGIEFNGKSRLVGRAVRLLQGPEEGGAIGPANSRSYITSTIDELNHRIAPNETFDVPACFAGLFAGDWDQAGYVTQRFAEAHVHPPMPDERYPWVQYNSWGYDQAIDEAQQLAAIERCAELGVEVVVMDLGWATRIGEWRAHPAKFPRGLRPLSERARALGMRFGLHIPLAQADVDSPVGREHPNWLIHPGVDYFGAAPLCLGHTPCREWLIEQIVRLVDDYGVDYFVQDGEDMVKRCDSTTHTHTPGDSNYANSVRGLDVVIETARRLRPAVVWENCEDGGCMLTYKMARLYNTTITVDNIATYATRQGVYGASYPFSPRYSVRYMQDDPTPYTLRSAIFGGPLILMQRVTEWDAGQVAQTREAIGQYKELRGLVRDAKVIHLLPPRYNVEGKGWGWDAIQAVSSDQSRSVVMVYRAMGDSERKVIRPRGLRPGTIYRVCLEDAAATHDASGETLAGRGIDIHLPEMSSEIIRIDALNAHR